MLCIHSFAFVPSSATFVRICPPIKSRFYIHTYKNIVGCLREKYSNLISNEKLCCATICKAWKQPFLESLWIIIRLNNYRNVEYICDMLTSQPNIFEKDTHRTRTLFLGKGLSMSEKQLGIIQQHFQYVETLGVTEQSLGSSEFGEFADWSQWKSLKNMDFCVEGLTLYNQMKEFLRILSFLPCLRHLETNKTTDVPSVVYKLGDFETIHLYLPKLEYMSILGNIEDFTTEDLVRIKTVVPAHKLTVAKFRIFDLDLRWLCYFSRKYPNLHTLELVCFPIPEKASLFRKEAIAMIPSLSNSFQRLTKVTINCTLGMGWGFTAFWDMLRQFGVSIKHLEYRLIGCHSDINQSIMTISKCTRSCSETLELLFMSNTLRCDNPSTIPNTLGSLPRLVDLCIIMEGVHIAIDALLDNCTALRKLRLTVKTISINSNDTSDITMHDLRSLELTKATTGTDVFNYLSHRCPQLNSMRLASMKVVGPVSKDTGVLYFDMSYTHFDYLHFTSVFFYATNDGTENDYSSVNLLNFGTSDPEMNPEGASETVFNLGDIENKMPLDDPLWLHVYCNIVSCMQIDDLRILDQEESDFTQEYFEAYESNVESYYPDHIRRSWWGQVPKESWKDDLHRGYVRFYFNYVGRYVIKTYDGCEDILWNKLYATL
ncbi:hypothetical protein F4703DRAFT_1817833, partial [Phycomyces blakesleeanus]